MSKVMTAQQFLAVALDVRNRFPQARLEKNAVGNLIIHEGDVYRGWVDLLSGAVEMVDYGEEAGGSTP